MRDIKASCNGDSPMDAGSPPGAWHFAPLLNVCWAEVTVLLISQRNIFLCELGAKGCD